jgi:Flp pilus assembly protein TadD
MTKQKNITGLCLLLFCFISFSSTAQEPAAKNTYAIVVGISGYQDAAIPKLNYADKDAMLFANWLQSNAGGSVPQYNIKLLTNENATISAVYNALDWVKEKATEGDIIYIYFSGHGDVETKDKNSQGYLLAWNSPPNNYRNNALSVTDLNDAANILTTKNNAKIILITDACHSGKMAGDFFKGKQFTAKNLQLVLNNQARLASCKEDEEAAEGLAWGGGRGIFSYYLLKGLQGEAEKNDLVKLENLQHYLDSCFAADTELKQSKHLQHPVYDGNPLFPLAKIDSATIPKIDNSENKILSPTTVSGLQSLRSVGQQPMDYFFAIAIQSGFESRLSSGKYENENVLLIPQNILADLIDTLKKPIKNIDREYYEDSLERLSSYNKNIEELKKRTDVSDSERNAGLIFMENDFKKNRQLNYEANVEEHQTVNHLTLLMDQLQKNSYSRSRFTDRFVQLVHDKSQEMINAYLRGDLAELEKRQYYATGNRNYRNFLPFMKIAIKLAPENNYLKDILEKNEAYLDGLTDRLDITTHASKADSLLNTASQKIKEALQMEPYSAYIHNELGNIYFQKKMYDSAFYHFNYATLLSPAWAIPYSNIIRVNLATDHLPKAIIAAHTADSLQPNLAFVNTNAGLVMERSGNLLAAESYYLRAIKENDVHYLPYERLGQLYMRTAEYAKADSFLYESKRRKELFAINDAVFKFGIEQGGYPELEDGESYANYCTDKNDSLLPGLAKYRQLMGAIGKLRSGKDSVKQEGKVISQKILQQWPDAVLLPHYLGKELYQEGNFSQAEIVLKKAIANYKSNKELKTYLKKQFTDSLPANALLQKRIKADIDSSCMLQIFIYLQYDGLEDHYLLAGLYEKNNKIEEALKEYKIISAIENKKQSDQAAVIGFYQPVKDPTLNEIKFKKYLYENDLDENKYLYKYNHPVLMGGALKTARLLEKQGKYAEAEQAYLSQVAENQSAGFVRQIKMNSNKSISTRSDNLNVYWLQINEDLESETFHFYDRMIALFPRDAYWYKNAGLFLFKRLLMTYSQVATAERTAFYNFAKTQAYPFKTSIEGPNEALSSDGFVAKDRIFYLPGTGEKIKIDTNRYEPLTKANYYLQQAMKFSGDKLPNRSFTEYVADLQSWMGMSDSAIINYQYLLKTESDNVSLRNKLVNEFRFNKQLPEVAENLEILQKNKKLAFIQMPELAEYEMLQQKYKQANALLQSYSSISQNEQLNKSFLYMKMYLLQQNYSAALTEAKKGVLLSKDDKEESNEFLYTIARIYALKNQQAAAMQSLQKLVKNKFQFYYLVNSDTAWDKIKNSAEWQKIANPENPADLYTGSESGGIGHENDNAVEKRIPALNK